MLKYSDQVMVSIIHSRPTMMDIALERLLHCSSPVLNVDVAV